MKSSAAPPLPRSRRFLAVPFVGKDAPSHASEYAHPDVAIGFSYLAYSYEGLRAADFQSTLPALRARSRASSAPSSRPAVGAVDRLGEGAPPRPRAARADEASPKCARRRARRLRSREAAASGGESDVESLLGGGDIRPLDRCCLCIWSTSNDAEYLRMLYHDAPPAIPARGRYYLENLVFPDTTAHQPSKLSANGQDLGGEMLFGVRIGFSGTPSSLLPLEMGECVYQKGDDAKMLRTLTAPEIVSVRKLPDDWSVRSLLERWRRCALLPHALIDAGALVTGF